MAGTALDAQRALRNLAARPGVAGDAASVVERLEFRTRHRHRAQFHAFQTPLLVVLAVEIVMPAAKT